MTQPQAAACAPIPVARPPRESSSFTAAQFHRLVEFAEARGWQDKPYHFVVSEWRQHRAH